MKNSLDLQFTKAQSLARELVAVLNAIKSDPDAKRVVIETGDDTEILANECDAVLMFIEGILDWEEA